MYQASSPESPQHPLAWGLAGKDSESAWCYKCSWDLWKPRKRRNSKEKIYFGKDYRGQVQSFFSLLSDDNSNVPWVSLHLQTSGTYSRCRCGAKLTWVLESNVLKGNWSHRHICTPWPAIRPNQESKHTWWNVMVSFSMLTTWFILPPCLIYRESHLT